MLINVIKRFCLCWLMLLMLIWRQIYVFKFQTTWASAELWRSSLSVQSSVAWISVALQAITSKSSKDPTFAAVWFLKTHICGLY